MTLSKERLEDICANELSAERREMARELLERRERDKQEPVATAHRLVNKLTGSVQQWKFTPGTLPASEGDTFQVEVMPLYSAPPAPVEPAAYEIIAEAWRLMDGQNPETSEWHTVASRYLNAYRTARATISNSADIAIDEASQSFGNSEQLEPVSPPYKLVGEVVAWDHPTKERSVDFRWLDYDVAPGTQLYAILRESE